MPTIIGYEGERPILWDDEEGDAEEDDVEESEIAPSGRNFVIAQSGAKYDPAILEFIEDAYVKSKENQSLNGNGKFIFASILTPLPGIGKTTAMRVFLTIHPEVRAIWTFNSYREVREQYDMLLKEGVLEEDVFIVGGKNYDPNDSGYEHKVLPSGRVLVGGEIREAGYAPSPLCIEEAGYKYARPLPIGEPAYSSCHGCKTFPRDHSSCPWVAQREESEHHRIVLVQTGGAYLAMCHIKTQFEEQLVQKAVFKKVNGKLDRSQIIGYKQVTKKVKIRVPVMPNRDVVFSDECSNGWWFDVDNSSPEELAMCGITIKGNIPSYKDGHRRCLHCVYLNKCPTSNSHTPCPFSSACHLTVEDSGDPEEDYAYFKHQKYLSASDIWACWDYQQDKLVEFLVNAMPELDVPLVVVASATATQDLTNQWWRKFHVNGWEEPMYYPFNSAELAVNLIIYNHAGTSGSIQSAQHSMDSLFTRAVEEHDLLDQKVFCVCNDELRKDVKKIQHDYRVSWPIEHYIKAINKYRNYTVCIVIWRFKLPAVDRYLMSHAYGSSMIDQYELGEMKQVMWRSRRLDKLVICLFTLTDSEIALLSSTVTKETDATRNRIKDDILAVVGSAGTDGIQYKDILPQVTGDNTLKFKAFKELKEEKLVIPHPHPTGRRPSVFYTLGQS